MIRYNAHGVAGLCDHCWKGGRPSLLTTDEQAELLAVVMAGPDAEKDGFSAFTRDDLVAVAKKRFGKSMHPTSMGRLLRRLGPVAAKGASQSPDEGPGRCSGL